METEDMKERIVVTLADGRRYAGEVYMASVSDGWLRIAVKGSVPITFPVTEIVGRRAE